MLHCQFILLTNARGVILAHTDFWGIQNVCQQWGVKMYYVYLCYCKQGDKLWHTYGTAVANDAMMVVYLF